VSAEDAINPPSSEELINKAWETRGKKDYAAAFVYTQRCIDLYQEDAIKQQAELGKGFPARGKEGTFQQLNDVATCYFIRAEIFVEQQKNEEAKKILTLIIEKFPSAQAWDSRGWWWSIAKVSQETLDKLAGTSQPRQEKKLVIETFKINLYDPGKEEMVNYEKYGKFEKEGSADYHYMIVDYPGLSQAVGEGIYPNTTAVMKDPDYLRLLDAGRLEGSHWDYVNSLDLQAAFYKLATAPEAQGVRLFFLGQILEKAGYYQHAVKAYYALLVHFPKDIGWTYWKTPWYVGQAAKAKIEFLTRNHPELGMRLVGADVKVVNGLDNDVRNDIFIVSPGRIVAAKPEELVPEKTDLSKLEITAERGGDKVKVVRYANGHWQLLVEGKPYLIRGITYAPTMIGQSPDQGTLGNWMEEDFDQNKKIDGPYDAWVDKNNNQVQDPDEISSGDFPLMQEMGVNTIRLYHHPAKISKELMRELFQNYGIRVIVGDFLGVYTIGSGAKWSDGTNYSNPEQRKNMLESVKQMVEEFKDEPWVLFWLLGNENNYGAANNSNKNPEAYYAFVNEAANLIKSLDPQRPVAICNGDVLFLDKFAKLCPDVDIFGANAYRGGFGFIRLWQDVKEQANKPVFITEFGCPAYYEGKSELYAENKQAEYHKGAWGDIEFNSAGYGEGNALGGVIFEWLDEWWKAYEPARHDWKAQWYGPFPDGYMHEEWLGLCGQGEGKQSPYLRHLRKAYFMYRKLWMGKDEISCDFGDLKSQTLTTKAWQALSAKNFEQAIVYAQREIGIYEDEAKRMQRFLKGYARVGEEQDFWALNDVATSYFIIGEAQMQLAEKDKAFAAFKKIIDDFSFAQFKAEDGQFVKLAEAAQERMGIYDFGDFRSSSLLARAGRAYALGNYEACLAYAEKVIQAYQGEAKKDTEQNQDLLPQGKEVDVKSLFDAAKAYYLSGQAYSAMGRKEEAKQNFDLLLKNFSFADGEFKPEWEKMAAEAKKKLEQMSQ
jgi:beta-glucuronidase